jgi:hypothetical protein
MARNRGKKALYEVMSRARSKSGYGRPPEQQAPTRPSAVEPAAAEPQAGPVVTKIAAKWWRKPRVVQLNAGRIEFSMPYQVAVAAGLVLVLALLASYRLGQFARFSVPVGPAPASGQAQQGPTENVANRTAVETPPPAAPADKTPPKTQKPEPVVPAGDNAIVLAHYHSMADLQPVQAHFAEYGIKTEIVPDSGRYILQTTQRYQNTTTRGSDGYNAIQKIKEIGALYKGKAPPGYETFAPNYFSDAYGRKVK